MNLIRVVFLAAIGLVGLGQAAGAQDVTQPAGGAWDVAVYPVFAWLPLDIGVDVDVPPIDGGEGESGQIVDSRFDGAFFGGVTASNGVWRVEGYGIWASFGGDRPERPFLVVEMDVIYGGARLGRTVAPDLYLTGGVRRVVLEYDVTLGELPRFSRKPGVWDPVVGILWHSSGQTVEWNALFEGGGFGVGADIDLGGSIRMDWKPARHFGVTIGYHVLYLKLTDAVGDRTVILKPLVHGPTVGIGLYF